MKKYYVIRDICVCCGAPVPEGRQVCRSCERGADGRDNTRGTRRVEINAYQKGGIEKNET